jgi:hypothetical protein
MVAFYARLMSELRRLDLHVSISRPPNEVSDAIRFDQDEVHREYDRDYANRFWRVLLQVDRYERDLTPREAGVTA